MKRWMIGTVVMIAALGMAQSALADAAPPPVPPGESVQGDYQTTMVRMMSEYVVIDIGDDGATVDATFEMQNQGQIDESFDVWFPLGGEIGDSLVFPIQDFVAYVDDKLVPTKNVPSACSGCSSFLPGPWETWPVAFPVGKAVKLRVTYKLQPGYPRFSGQYVQYHYVLQTGAGWYDTIGSGQFVVKLPYKISEYNVLPNSNFAPTDAGDELEWSFTNLEPKNEDNVSVTVLSPPLARAIEDGQNAVVFNPSSASAHWRLAKALDEASRSSRGVSEGGRGRDMAAEAVREYKESIRIDLSNGDVYADYAGLLWAMEIPGSIPGDEVWIVLNEGLKVDPNNQNLIELQTNLTNYSRRAVAGATQSAHYWLTQTPHPTASPDPIPTLVLTAKSTGMTASEQTNDQVQTPDWFILIGSVIMIIGVAAFFVVRWYRRPNTG